MAVTNNVQKITRNQYISMSGVNRYTVAYLKRCFELTEVKTIKEWTTLLIERGAIDSTPPALLHAEQGQSNEKEKSTTKRSNSAKQVDSSDKSREE